MTEILSKNLKYLRKLRNISQQELADKTNLDRSTISRIENNEMDTTIEKAYKMALVLNVPIELFIGKNLEEMNYSINDDAKYIDIINKYKMLSKNDQELVDHILETRNKQNSE